jgi:hypothetical protein
MRPLTISPENQQRLAIAVPSIALLLSLFVVYPTWGRYRDLLETVKKDRADLAALQAQGIPNIGANVPAVPNLPSEPPEFLGQLRIIAQLSECTLTGFDISGTAKKEEGPVKAVRARVEIDSRYNGIRQFLANLSSAPRLYVVTECSVASKVKAGQPGARTTYEDPSILRATIEIERYVTKAGP